MSEAVALVTCRQSRGKESGVRRELSVVSCQLSVRRGLVRSPKEGAVVCSQLSVRREIVRSPKEWQYSEVSCQWLVRREIDRRLLIRS
jgi:hypothetical protein